MLDFRILDHLLKQFGLEVGILEDVDIDCESLDLLEVMHEVQVHVETHKLETAPKSEHFLGFLLDSLLAGFSQVVLEFVEGFVAEEVFPAVDASE